MKNLIIIFLMFLSFRAYTQEYSLNTSPYDIPVNGYLKDMENKYNKYIGLWKGNWNGKTIYLELKKVKYYYTGSHPFYSDELLGERKILDYNGNIEIDRISNFDYQHPEIWGMGLPTGVNGHNYPSLNFYPKSMCGINARLAITNITPTQMTLHLTAIMGGTEPNCIHDAYVQQHGEYPVNFPKDIVLTKQ